MRETIFLSVTSHPKFETRIGQFGSAAGCAFVEWLRLGARLHFKAFPAG